jgi:Flp pilus assembly protein TadG
MRSSVKRIDKNGRERGNALIEASLILMLFTIIVFSLFDFGFSLFVYQTLLHQARSAARYGSVNPTDTTGIQNVALYGATTGSGKGFMGISASNVNVQRLGTAGGPDDRIKVTISSVPFVMITPGFAGPRRAAATASIPVEN